MAEITEKTERYEQLLDEALSVTVSVATEGAYAGKHPENFVNWLAGDERGLQIELGPTGRGEESGNVRAVLRSLL